MTKRKAKTAEELLAELQNDETYQRELSRKDAKRASSSQRSLCAQKLLLKDLSEAGFEVETVWDLVNSSEPYPTLIPVLLKHLQEQYPPRIKEGIARALAVPDARKIWNELVAIFLAEPNNEVKWALHLALAAAADRSVLHELIALARDQKHGRNRAMFIDALFRIHDPCSQEALVALARDPYISEDVERVLRKK